MEAPKCKICQARHYGLCGIRDDRMTSAQSKTVAKGPRTGRDTPSVKSVGERLPQSVTAGETAPKFDRAAYQREYMRKYRARLRAKALGDAT